MSFVTSSAINKSGKTLAPKAAARRRGPDRRAPVTSRVARPPTPETTQRATEEDSAGESEDVNGPGASNTEYPGVIDPRLRDHAPTPDPTQTDGSSTEVQQTAVNGTSEQSMNENGPPPAGGTKRKRNTRSRVAQSNTEASDENVDEAGNADDDAGAVAEADEEAAAEASGTPRPRARPRKRARASDTGAAIDEESQMAAVRKSRATRVRKKPLSAETVRDGDEDYEEGQDQNSAEGEGGSADGDTEPTTRQRKRRRRPRVQAEGDEGAEGTEGAEGDGHRSDDSEQHEINEQKTTMDDLLTKRPKGQTSELEKRMRLIDWKEVARKRREPTPPPAVAAAAAEGEGNNGTGATGDEPEEALAERARNNQNTMQLRMVNGQIVLDEASQQIDRQAQALANAEGLAVDENADLTKRVNNLSWINDRRRDPADRVSVYKQKHDTWDDDETDRFYDALRMFGTDFSIISKMFPPRTRRHIKLKFVREERVDPARINLALSAGQVVPMDLEHFAMAAGVDPNGFKDPAIINAELDASKKANDIEIEKKRAEAIEAHKQREIMNVNREKEKAERDREKEMHKAQRDEARRRKKGLIGTGTF